MHPRYRLVLAANRDEFHARPTRPASFWNENANILGGKDLKAGGTWLGITKTGRLCGITAYRDPRTFRPDAPSRGKLVSAFLDGKSSPGEYMRDLQASAFNYNGFNLIAGDNDSLWYFSNRGDEPRELEPGIYGLSNHLLDTPWPKVVKGRGLLEEAMRGDEVSLDEIFSILEDREKPPDNLLPDTGVGMDLERLFSSIFISSPVYGTRSSTVLIVDRRGGVTFVEKEFGSQQEILGVRKFHFEIDGKSF